MTERAKTGARTKKRDGGGGERRSYRFLGTFSSAILAFSTPEGPSWLHEKPLTAPDRYATDTSCEQLLQVTDINSVMTS